MSAMSSVSQLMFGARLSNYFPRFDVLIIVKPLHCACAAYKKLFKTRHAKYNENEKELKNAAKGKGTTIEPKVEISLIKVIFRQFRYKFRSIFASTRFYYR